MTIVRALLPAFILTFLVTAILAAAGAHGGVMAIQQAPLAQYHFFWSWPIFCLFTAVSWAILTMMR